ncbi:MAG: Glycosyltransferase [Parcubacteria group bacterium Gr01-1014_29]|nr:MAG: Glycosyltransferase [Parcubacteria group bacterium Gr01-1014_29]
MQQQENRIKVCFIVPEKAEDTATHFAHKWEMIQELKNTVEFLSYWPNGLDVFRIIWARMRGCSTYYVHYSFKGALLAIITTSVFGGRVFYWNCGMPWLYKRGWFEERLFWFILRHTILVIGTDGLANEYADRYGLDKKNIRVVPNYIRVSRMQGVLKTDARKELNLPQDKKIVLFLHHLSRRKGADLLPEIIKEFKDRDDVLFVIVGDGPERKKIELRITNYELGEKVQFKGRVPNNRTQLYFVAADVYLMPSEEEGMPNALLEAMAAGVPFVASDVAAVREMTPPDTAEFVLPYGDTKAFAEKIEKLLADEELRKRIASEEWEWVQRYDVSVIAEKFLKLLQE